MWTLEFIIVWMEKFSSKIFIEWVKELLIYCGSFYICYEFAEKTFGILIMWRHCIFFEFIIDSIASSAVHTFE